MTLGFGVFALVLGSVVFGFTSFQRWCEHKERLAQMREEAEDRRRAQLPQNIPDLTREITREIEKQAALKKPHSHMRISA